MAADGSISNQGDILAKLDDGTVINLAEVVKELLEDNLTTKILQNVLAKLNVDSSGRLRCSSEYVANITTLTNCGTGQIGILGSTALAQAESQMRFQSSFRRNLVVT